MNRQEDVFAKTIKQIYCPAAIGQKRQQDNLCDNFIIHGGKKQGSDAIEAEREK